MSKSLTDGYFALVLICSLGLLAIGGVSFSFWYSKGYQSADQEHSAYYANRDAADIKYRECIDGSASLDSARDCIKNAADAGRESERSEEDLNAQREMADWAEGMLWATWSIGLGTIGATILGVRYVYLTLVATQEMAADTTRIGDAQLTIANAANNITLRAITEQDRPFLVVEPTESTMPTWPDGKENFTWNATVTNMGKSPAYISKVTCELVCGDMTRKIMSSPGIHEIAKPNGMTPGLSREFILRPDHSFPLSKSGGDIFLWKIRFDGGAGYDGAQFVSDLKSGNISVWMIVNIRYRDQHLIEREARATFKHDFPHYTVTMDGGQAYNFDRRADDEDSRKS